MHIYPALLLGRGKIVARSGQNLFLEMFFQKQGKTVLRQLEVSIVPLPGLLP
jgi:hypothetical protein